MAPTIPQKNIEIPLTSVKTPRVLAAAALEFPSFSPFPVVVELFEDIGRVSVRTRVCELGAGDGRDEICPGPDDDDDVPAALSAGGRRGGGGRGRAVWEEPTVMVLVGLGESCGWGVWLPASSVVVRIGGPSAGGGDGVGPSSSSLSLSSSSSSSSSAALVLIVKLGTFTTNQP